MTLMAFYDRVYFFSRTVSGSADPAQLVAGFGAMEPAASESVCVCACACVCARRTRGLRAHEQLRTRSAQDDGREQAPSLKTVQLNAEKLAFVLCLANTHVGGISGCAVAKYWSLDSSTMTFSVQELVRQNANNGTS